MQLRTKEEILEDSVKTDWMYEKCTLEVLIDIRNCLKLIATKNEK